eukprot:COSAG05_NODE_110_length_18660_cov_2.692635_5_plen_967_part_00
MQQASTSALASLQRDCNATRESAAALTQQLAIANARSAAAAANVANAAPSSNQAATPHAQQQEYRAVAALEEQHRHTLKACADKAAADRAEGLAILRRELSQEMEHKELEHSSAMARAVAEVREEMADELRRTNEEHATSLTRTVSQHEAVLARTVSQHQVAISKVMDAHGRHAENLENMREQHIRRNETAAQNSAEAQMAALQAEYTGQLRRERASHVEAMAALRTEYEEQLRLSSVEHAQGMDAAKTSAAAQARVDIEALQAHAAAELKALKTQHRLSLANAHAGTAAAKEELELMRTQMAADHADALSRQQQTLTARLNAAVSEEHAQYAQKLDRAHATREVAAENQAEALAALSTEHAKQLQAADARHQATLQNVKSALEARARDLAAETERKGQEAEARHLQAMNALRHEYETQLAQSESMQAAAFAAEHDKVTQQAESATATAVELHEEVLASLKRDQAHTLEALAVHHETALVKSELATQELSQELLHARDQAKQELFAEVGKRRALEVEHAGLLDMHIARRDELQTEYTAFRATAADEMAGERARHEQVVQDLQATHRAENEELQQELAMLRRTSKDGAELQVALARQLQEQQSLNEEIMAEHDAQIDQQVALTDTHERWAGQAASIIGQKALQQRLQALLHRVWAQWASQTVLGRQECTHNRKLREAIQRALNTHRATVQGHEDTLVELQAAHEKNLATAHSQHVDTVNRVRSALQGELAQSEAKATEANTALARKTESHVELASRLQREEARADSAASNLIEALATVRKQAAASIQRMAETHQQELNRAAGKQKEAIKTTVSQHAQALGELEARHAAALASQTASNAQELAAAKARSEHQLRSALEAHDVVCTDLADTHSMQVHSMETAKAEHVQMLQTEHEEQLAEHRCAQEAATIAHAEEVNSVRRECVTAIQDAANKQAQALESVQNAATVRCVYVLPLALNSITIGIVASLR